MPLAVESLCVSQGKFRLGPVDLTFDAPGLTVLLGHNGAGKSTLLKALAGVSRPDTGQVMVDGHRLTSGRERRLALQGCGYVPQRDELPLGARARDVLEFAAWLKKVPARSVGPRLGEVADRLSIAPLLERRVASLSGGERQRVSIAAALLHTPSVLLLDEPTTGLDPVQRVGLRSILSDLAHECVVIVSTHLVEDVDASKARVLILSGGRVVHDGTAATLEEGVMEGAHGATALERGIWTVLTRGDSVHG